jgi:hypothetical protein
MTSLRAALTDYPALRRSLGFRLERDEKLLVKLRYGWGTATRQRQWHLAEAG